MATRFYFPESLTSPIAPSFKGAWNETTAAVRRRMVIAKGASAITAGSAILTTQSLANRQGLDRQYISDELVAQTLSPAGAWTATGQIMTAESALNDNVDRVSVGVYVVSNDGATLRGTMLSLNSYATSVHEYEVSPTYENRVICDGDALSQVVAQDGDRIIIEIGHRISSVGGTSISARAKWGENAADLPIEVSGAEAQQTDGAPWFEFSGDVVFKVTRASGVVTPYDKRMNWGPMLTGNR